MEFANCISSNEFWEFLNLELALVIGGAIFGCFLICVFSIRDLAKNQVNKKTWISIVLFSVMSLFTAVLLDSANKVIPIDGCGYYAKVIVGTIVKIIEVLILGAMLGVTSSLFSDAISKYKDNGANQKIKHREPLPMPLWMIALILGSSVNLINLLIIYVASVMP